MGRLSSIVWADGECHHGAYKRGKARSDRREEDGRREAEGRGLRQRRATLVSTAEQTWTRASREGSSRLQERQENGLSLRASRQHAQPVKARRRKQGNNIPAPKENGSSKSWSPRVRFFTILVTETGSQLLWEGAEWGEGSPFLTSAFSSDVFFPISSELEKWCWENACVSSPSPEVTEVVCLAPSLERGQSLSSQ